MKRIHPHKYLLFFLLSPLFLSAQNKMLTMEEAVLKGNSTLGPANLAGLQWHTNTSFTYTKDKNLLERSIGQKEGKVLLDLRTYNSLLSSIKLDSARSIPEPMWLTNGDGLFMQDNALVLYHAASGKVELASDWDKEAENTDLDKERMNIAYTKDNNLFIALKNGEKIQVTNEENKGIVNGQAVHRNEFGIKKGTFWSPQGSFLAFYRMDQSMVTDYPIVQINTRPAKEKAIKYPMAGMKSHEVTVGVYSLKTKKTVFLNTGEPKEQYLTNISWSPDEKYVYIAVLNRGQNHMWLNKYDAGSGEFVKTLFEETNDKYVEPLNPLIFFKKNPHEFLYMSQRDGWMHFYHYNDEGKLLGQITKGNWLVAEYLGMDPEEKNIYYLSTEESPLDLVVCSVNISSKKITRISKNKGIHQGFLSPDGKNILDKYTSAEIPREIDVINSKGELKETVLKADNPLKDYQLGTTKIVTLKADDGTVLYGRVILPPGFNSSKKYPCVTYLYNGPHVQLVNNSWLSGSNLWMQLMAQQGYVVFTMDGRGSMNRGLAFEQATFRQLGTVEMKDQQAGNQYLRSLPYVDTARMGIHGWSFGGFMTTTMMLRSPGSYKVGVAGGPVIDWKYYEVMYTERYMDTPEENKDGYEKANLLNYVKNLRGKLLMIHGTVDDVVVWQHSLMFVKKCVDEGKQLDYFVYPGHPHNVYGKDRVHLMQKITDYFKSNL